MHKLVLIRHGESIWNQENRFTGWTDVDLAEKGIQEAKAAAATLTKEGFTFDIAFTSVLKRAIRTLWTIQDEMDLLWIPTFKSWRLNERHYGDLQGLNKTEMANKFGEKQVQIWRRSYDTPPPALPPNDPRQPARDPRYAQVDPKILPSCEALKDTVARVVPYWEGTIAPEVRAGKKVIVAAHGNSLRALIKYLDHLSEQEIVEMNVPTGIPLVYELDSNLKPVGRRYLGDAEAVQKAIASVAKQGKASGT